MYALAACTYYTFHGLVLDVRRIIALYEPLKAFLGTDIDLIDPFIE